MAGSACYNIVYMSERISTRNTYRVTGKDLQSRKNNSLMIRKRHVILLLFMQNKANYYLLVFTCFSILY